VPQSAGMRESGPDRIDSSLRSSPLRGALRASVGRLRRPRIEPVTPAFGVRYFVFKQLNLLMLTGGAPIAIAVLCTTVQHSVTQISHTAEKQTLNIYY
jgi:hypothetical protein